MSYKGVIMMIEAMFLKALDLTDKLATGVREK